MHRLAASAFITAYAALAATPLDRAIAYLSQEVPRWARENGCYSCHNNGDAARALYRARHLGYTGVNDALADTTQWLINPAKWDANRGSPAFSDKKLARIQFAAALAEAVNTGAVRERKSLEFAAELLLPYQDEDGSWTVDIGVAVGSPATYGTALATYMARTALETASTSRFARPIAKANAWLRTAQPASILDAASIVLALPTEKDRHLSTILKAQTSDGGWGPHLHAPAEPFDTAVVLLALKGISSDEQVARAISRGRSYLVSEQQASGGWPETTRPPGSQSYAQHMSTSGWATLALLVTDLKGK